MTHCWVSVQTFNQGVLIFCDCMNFLRYVVLVGVFQFTVIDAYQLTPKFIKDELNGEMFAVCLIPMKHYVTQHLQKEKMKDKFPPPSLIVIQYL